jgi:hypothetical protein
VQRTQQALQHITASIQQLQAAIGGDTACLQALQQAQALRRELLGVVQQLAQALAAQQGQMQLLAQEAGLAEAALKVGHAAGQSLPLHKIMCEVYVAWLRSLLWLTYTLSPWGRFSQHLQQLQVCLHQLTGKSTASLHRKPIPSNSHSRAVAGGAAGAAAAAGQPAAGGG